MQGGSYRGFALIELSIVLFVIGCASATEVQAASPVADSAISLDDPLILSMRMEAEKIQRCNEKAKTLWDGLKPEERDGLRAILGQPPSPTERMPELLLLLQKGETAKAEAFVRRTYSVDARRASLITSFIGYANEIETEPMDNATTIKHQE